MALAFAYDCTINKTIQITAATFITSISRTARDDVYLHIDLYR
jgi:hypothetical protein